MTTTSAGETLLEKLQVIANLFFRLTVASGYNDAISPSAPLLRRQNSTLWTAR